MKITKRQLQRIIRETVDTDEWYEDRHREDQNDMGYYIAVALENTVKNNPGRDGASLLKLVRQDPEYSSLLRGIADEVVWEIADEMIEEGTLLFNVEEDSWHYAPDLQHTAERPWEHN